MMALLILVSVAIWSWLGRGPIFFRWPALVGLTLLTSGHPLGIALARVLDGMAEPLLALFFVFLGISIILKPIFGGSRRRYTPRRYDDPRREGRGWYDQW